MQPIVIVGAGPVGLRCAQEILASDENHKVIVLGKETWCPYNRVRLTGFLGHDYALEEIELPTLQSYSDRFQLKSGSEVLFIDRQNRYIETRDGEIQDYSKLILAVGSQAFIPDIQGIKQVGVYTFRDLNDAIALQARQTSSRHIVVIGGGPLGLEAARAMRVHHTKVTVIEHNNHLMYQQLDAEAGRFLQQHMEAMSIMVLTNNNVCQVLGNHRVEAVELRNGDIIECDTVIVAAGIRPNTSLALESGLTVGRGIKVNNQLQTNDPNIFAIGDCAEHNKVVYGLVAPGFEQAAVVVAALKGGDAQYGDAQYVGSTTSTTLKVAGCSVFSAGKIDRMRDTRGDYIFEDRQQGIYRRLQIDNGRLVGGIGIGEWLGKGRLQEAIRQGRLTMPWQRYHFKQHGELWPEGEEKSVGAWPATAIVCHCVGVNRGQLSGAITIGCTDFASLSQKTGASTVCGSCKPDIQNLLGGSAPIEPNVFWKPISIAAIFATLTALLYLFWPGLPYQDSVMTSFRWDSLWRDSFARKVSGFSLLGGGILLSLISFRKRIKRFDWLDFSFWRVIHVVLGALLLITLLVHSGARLGDNLNFWLMLSFIGVLLSGGLLGVGFGHEHQLPAKVVRRVRNGSLWLHLLFLWPLPVLLSFHVLKAFYFK